ncbi:MAG TPA: signal peptidase I [Thermoanaerobaculia bacterium]|nr:signal peptidase I [Thermoanaerobaculia bacterium]
MTEAEESTRSTLREYFDALLIAMIFVNFARIFVFQAFKIPTGSMIDNLLIGDHIVVNKFIYGAPGAPAVDRLLPLRPVRRGDIVVFRYPEQPDTDFVKRVIGLPDETVTIRDKRVLVDGVPLDEPYVLHDDPEVIPREPSLPRSYRSRDQFGPYVVPEGSYFVMGDNRDRSNDSRYWGPVRRELIKGRALLVYWSYDGPPAPEGATPGERLTDLARVVLNFIPGTRWERTFRIVDGARTGRAVEPSPE